LAIPNASGTVTFLSGSSVVIPVSPLLSRIPSTIADVHDSRGSSTSRTGVIVGALIGSLILAGIIVFLILIVLRRRASASEDETQVEIDAETHTHDEEIDVNGPDYLNVLTLDGADDDPDDLFLDGIEEDAL
jgi:hypothetical protein